MTHCIAFHSYKGGTGKTTMACNLAAMLAAKGRRVALLDLDVYAPSLHVYFGLNPDKWINDLLSGSAKLGEVMVDQTQALKNAQHPVNSDGRLWIGFSNPKKEEIYKLDGDSGKEPSAKLQNLRKFMNLHEELTSDLGCDYIIIDTSPGIRYWSVNSLAVADTIFLTLKFGDLDIEGTKKMAADMYGSFTRFGAKSYLLLNRVAGYCVPNTQPEGSAGHHHPDSGDHSDQLALQIGMDMLAAIPCYCDIQFKRKEFLTALQNPDHPFARQLEQLAAAEPIRA